MSFDGTMKFKTNMSRQEIDVLLPQLKTMAENAGLANVAHELTATAGLPVTELASRVTRCFAAVNGKPDLSVLTFQLDMLLLNLRNLK